MKANLIANYKKLLFFGWKGILIVILDRFAVMLIFKYSNWLFVLLMLAFAFTANAQQNHFVYLQTDNGKPFYVKMDQKILSSSSEGYIILPGIASGIYQLKVGFPQKEYPEESFSITVGDENEGYLIKHFEDKGLQLFNMETLALISGDRDTSAMMLASGTKDTNPFTKMLANVVKDSTILQNHEVVVENPAKSSDTSKVNSEVAANAVSTSPDTLTTAQNNPVSPSANPLDSSATTANSIPPSTSPADSSVATAGSPISKLTSTQDKDGLTMVYADGSGDKSDTVKVLMPAGKELSGADSEATKKDSFDFSANNSRGNTSGDTSQFTITPTIEKPSNEKKGSVLRKDTIATAADSATEGKTAPEQVFYIGPKEKEKQGEVSENTSSNERKGLFSGLSKNTKKEATETTKPAANNIEVLPNEAAPSNSNSDCKAFADNEDFLRLRKKMASEDSKDAMIKVANKFFRSRCFSTSQIKDLSYLFLTDEGKYMFFDAAYPHTSDSDQFPALESQLKDKYYQNRFEAMIKK